MNQEIKLSSAWSTFGLYLATFLLVFVSFAIIMVSENEKLHAGMIFSGILYVIIVGFLVYLFIYNSKATIIGNQLVLKKQFRQAKTYTFDQIGRPSSFRLKNTRYVTFEMKNNDLTTEKFLIINHRSLLALNKIDVEATLQNLRKLT